MNFEQVPFKKQIGIELTFVPMRPDSYHLNSYWDNGLRWPGFGVPSWSLLTSRLRSKAKTLKVPGYSKIYQDPGCVEFPSPILRSWEQAKSWYEQAVAAAEKVQLTPYEESQEGGCGHIHMGGLSDMQRRHVIVEAYKHPYLSWFFASPNGSAYCRSIAGQFVTDGKSSLYCSAASRSLFDNLDTPATYYDNRPRIFGRLAGKTCILSNRPNTLEWRAFDAAADWDEQASMIGFYQRFVDYSQSANAGRFADLSPDLMPHKLLLLYRYNAELCIKGFKRLIAAMGLDWADYKHLVKLNLRPAFVFGKRH